MESRLSSINFDTNTLLLYGGCCIGIATIPVGLGYMLGGAMHHPISSLFGLNAKPEVTGFVAPGYEYVKEVFSQIMEDGMEDKVQAAAFVDGELVVNLVGIVDPERSTHDATGAKYSDDSTQNVFSSTKALSSVVVAMLVDRGLLRYDMFISDVWPGNTRPHIISSIIETNTLIVFLYINNIICRVCPERERGNHYRGSNEARGWHGKIRFRYRRCVSKNPYLSTIDE